MSVLDLARPELRALKGYSSARMESSGGAVLLNANESPWTPYEEDALALNRYPEPQPPALIGKLCEIYRVAREQLLVGRGSDEMIDLLTRAFCRAGQDAVLIMPPTFGMYRVCAGIQGAAVREVPLLAEADFQVDWLALQAAITPAVKLVYLCTPNNPTGGEFVRAPLFALLEKLRGRALVVVDEAYGEFSAQPSWSTELDKFEHLVVLRTLSKAYGLAGARVGCALAHPELIALLRKLIAPYPLPSPVVDAALRGLAQPEQVQARIVMLISERERVRNALQKHPAVDKVWPSAANFLCFRVDNAAARYARLAAGGVVVRDVSHYLGLADCLRVSVGTREENSRFLEALGAT